MERVFRIATLLVVLLAGWCSASAQEISLTASVDRNSIAAGEQLQLTITLTNAQGSYSAPDLGGLVVVRGPYESTNINVVGGRMVSSVSRIWVLTATTPGKYTIGSAKARVGGGIIETTPITIEVVAAKVQAKETEAAQAQSRDANLFASISLSRNKAYVGEQVVATYTLYSRYSNVDLSKYDLPKLNGFWAEDVPSSNTSWEEKIETINGVQYKVAILKRQVLFAQRSGKLRIEPLQLSCVVNRSFFNRGTAIDIRSNAVEFTALELPGNTPADFKGAVGELELSVKADRTAVKADEAIEITVRISGRSNLKLLEAPTINFPSDFEVYDPKVTDKISVNAAGMSGEREFQYLVIPRVEGSYTLDPITFSYFDGRSGSYKTLRSEALELEVSVSDGSATAPVRRSNKSDVQQLGTDIRYIRSVPLALRPLGDRLYGSVRWFAGMGAPALAFFLLLAWKRKRDNDLADASGMRRKGADKLARGRLKQAAAALHNNAPSDFYTALGQALHGYLKDKLGLGVAELTTEQIRTKLAAHKGGEQLALDFTRLLTTCDMARYAPVEERPRKDLYEEAVQLIGRTEQLLRA